MLINKKISFVLVSCGIILASAAAVTIGTYALFSDSAKITNHLTGGNLDLTLKRTKLTYTKLNAEGVQEVKVDTTEKDFSAPSSENLFDFTTSDKFIPTDYRVAEMKLSNSSSVAYNWYLSIVLDGDANEFAEQLLVEVDTDKGTAGYEYSATLDQGLTIGSASSPISTVKVGSTAEFAIKISFKDLADNNAAKNKEVSFDVTVNALQYVKS